MAVEVEHVGQSLYLRKFKLYETRSKFYLIGRDKSRTIWRVLKIERDVPSELNISEDPTNYTQSECYDLLRRVHDGNATTGGLKFVTDCYGIVGNIYLRSYGENFCIAIYCNGFILKYNTYSVKIFSFTGFVKFLGPYHILLITKRMKIGYLCGHTVYAVSKSNMIPLSSTKLSNNAYSKDENRYKRLLCTVDITKDFFFSYSYHIMCSLQRNICDGERGQIYETMFVWNEYLTRGIRNHLKNTMWTVALVHGFFKQSKLSVSGKEFIITLIARRSRHFAGTRYLKRGVNVKGRVANDVETEQIVCENTPEGTPAELSSVVQIRGSIPLFWSQESSWRNIKPDIILHKDQNYESTRRHFDNLVKRYGNPIIILNLIKTKEKKPRESVLHEEFVKAIDYINSNLPKESRLRFLHWDLKEYARKKSTNVLPVLAKVAAYALDLTGFFYCEVPPTLRLQSSLTWPIPELDILSRCNKTHDDVSSHKHSIDGSDMSHIKSSENISNNDVVGLTKPWMLQKGVLRTNCIDCLDRTNVAQCAYGLTALGKQLHALGFIDNPKFDLDTALADELINLYESMGDTLALQYGGSGAHNKIFCERRGQWKAATQSQELLRSIQRYYSNAYMDAEKQDAINVFLGHFQPQPGKPALWELDSDQHCNIGNRGHSVDEVSRSFIRRSLSDGNFIHEHSAPISSHGVGKKVPSNLTTVPKENAEGFSDSQSETICSSKSDISHIRYTPATSHAHVLTSNDFDFYNEVKLDGSSCSNFLDFDWISSCENSCYDENESTPINSPMSSRNSSVTSIKLSQGTDAVSSSSSLAASTSDNIIFPQSFIHWVENGGTFCH